MQPAPDKRSDSGLAALLGGVFFLLYLLCPASIANDSIYTFLQAQTLLERGQLDLRHAFEPPLEPANRFYVTPGKTFPYQIKTVPDGALTLWYPRAPALLAVPFVAVLRAAGFDALGPAGQASVAGEVAMQRIVASILGAVIVALAFLLARQVLEPRGAFGVAVVAGIATPVFSTLSRLVWTDTWGTIFLTLALLAMLRAEGRGLPIPAVLVASLLSWCYFCKPTYSTSIVAITLYVVLRHRGVFLLFAAVGAAWAALFFSVHWYTDGHPLPDYYRLGRDLQFARFPEAIFGVLISPGRGLLLFTPCLLWVAPAIAARWRWIDDRLKPMVILSAAATGVFLVLLALWPCWWGANSYGPRIQAGVMPWLFVLGSAAVAVSAPRWSRRESAVPAALVVLSAFAHGRGAIDQRVEEYNWRPRYIDNDTARLWDWRRPQFLEGIVPILPLRYPPWPENTAFDFRPKDANQDFLLSGWGEGEPHWRWSDGGPAVIAFGLETVPSGPAELWMHGVGFHVEGRLELQRARFILNGTPIGTLELRSPHPERNRVAIPAGVLEHENRLVIELPDAIAPREVKPTSADPRRIAIGVISMEWQRAGS